MYGEYRYCVTFYVIHCVDYRLMLASFVLIFVCLLIGYHFFKITVKIIT